MPLDFVDTAAQIEGMADELRSRKELREHRLRNALDVMRDFPVDAYEERRRRGDFGGTAPEVKEPPDTVHGLPEAPHDHTVAAVDGSHIDVDRHLAARCFLINTGSVVLTYGSQPDVELEGRARLYARADEMVIHDPGGGADQRIEGAVLGAKRTAEEMLRLVEVVRSLPGDVPTLALVDGPLVMLGLIGGRGYGDFVRRELVEEGFAAALEELGALAAERPLALAGYVSMPGYTEAAAALRYVVCEERRFGDAMRGRRGALRQVRRRRAGPDDLRGAAGARRAVGAVRRVVGHHTGALPGHRHRLLLRQHGRRDRARRGADMDIRRRGGPRPRPLAGNRPGPAGPGLPRRPHGGTREGRNQRRRPPLLHRPGRAGPLRPGYAGADVGEGSVEAAAVAVRPPDLAYAKSQTEPKRSVLQRLQELV